jgi:hypothetical protein
MAISKMAPLIEEEKVEKSSESGGEDLQKEEETKS